MILTRTVALPHLAAITIAPLTRTIRNIPSEVIVDTTDGLKQRSVITLDNISTVEQDRLVQLITTLSADRMNEVWEAIHYALDLPY